jgi:hypothetical protein
VEKQEYFSLICMIDIFVLSKKLHDFPPMSSILLLFNNLQTEELAGDSGLDFPNE